jgi:hypothetical protein
MLTKCSDREGLVKTITRTVAAGLLITGCVNLTPTIRYSGTTLEAKPREKLTIYRGTKPDRSFVEMGTVEVSCPVLGRDGGCTYDEALQYGIDRAAYIGADAIYGIQTAAAGNGTIVSMTVIAVRFQSDN